MHICRDASQCEARAALAGMGPTGSLGEATIIKELLQGPLIGEWAVARYMSLTRNEFTVADRCPDVDFALTLGTLAESGAMIADTEGLYQVPVDLE